VLVADPAALAVVAHGRRAAQAARPTAPAACTSPPARPDPALTPRP